MEEGEKEKDICCTKDPNLPAGSSLRRIKNNCNNKDLKINKV
jgi:hypothetical protein